MYFNKIALPTQYGNWAVLLMGFTDMPHTLWYKLCTGASVGYTFQTHTHTRILQQLPKEKAQCTRASCAEHLGVPEVRAQGLVEPAGHVLRLRGRQANHLRVVNVRQHLRLAQRLRILLLHHCWRPA
jgi:hypothetical protein